MLRHKPGALPGSTALAQARKTGAFTRQHQAFWDASRRVNGDSDGTRELIDVLLLHRSLPDQAVTAGIDDALSVGAVTADVVAVQARRHAGPHTHPDQHTNRDTPRPADRRVIHLPQHRHTDPEAVLAELPPDTRPAPTLTAYDQLLARRHDPGAGTTSGHENDAVADTKAKTS